MPVKNSYLQHEEPASLEERFLSARCLVLILLVITSSQPPDDCSMDIAQTVLSDNG